MSRRSEEDDAEAWLTFWLRFTIAIRNSKKLGIARLPLATWQVLVYLQTRPEGSSVDEIRKACAIPVSTASRLLNTLDGVGYIARGFANDDARRHVVRLSKDGRTALGKVFHAARSDP